MFRQSCVHVCVLVLVFRFLSVASISFAADPKSTVILGLQDDTLSLDPAKSYESIGWTTLGKVYEKLVTFTRGDFSHPVPELAESWELGDDGKTWDFAIRQQVFFASGNPVNADAVIFSLRRALKVGGDSAERPTWLLTQFGITAESITKIDDYRVQIVLDKPYAPTLFLSCLAGVVGSILDPKVVMAHEQHGDMGSAWLEEHSAGSGLYAIDERKPGEYLVLKRNPRHWRDSPRFDRIVVKNVQEPVAQMAMLLNGEIDIAFNLQAQQLDVLADHPDIRIYETMSLDLTHLLMNCGYPPLGKPEVRDAIRYAIDYKGLIEAVFDGKAVEIQTCIPRGLLGHNPATPYRPDLEKARKLVAEAGYPDGFQVTLNHFPYSPWTEMGLKIKSDLAKIGIQIDISQAPVAKTLKTRDYQLTLIEWTPDYPDPDVNAKAFAYADRIDAQAPIKLRAWQASYLNPQTTELVRKAAQELDIEMRQHLYATMTNRLLDDGPYVFLCSPIRQYAVRAGVADFVQELSILWFEFPI